MTEQYAQNSINRNGAVVNFASTIADPGVRPAPENQLLVVNSTVAAATVQLPPLSTVSDNITITVFKSVAANTVAVVASPGDFIAKAAVVLSTISAIGGSLTIKSYDGINWLAVDSTV